MKMPIYLDDIEDLICSVCGKIHTPDTIIKAHNVELRRSEGRNEKVTVKFDVYTKEIIL